MRKKTEVTICSSAAEYLTFVAPPVIAQRVMKCGMRTKYLADPEDDGDTVRCVKADHFPAYSAHI